MFGKLLKNDLKAQWQSMSAIFLCSMIIAVAGELVAFFKDTAMAKVFGGLATVLSLLFACVFVIIAVTMMFNKTMFGRAGYLTLTLPVKTSKLIWSKTLSGLIWTYLIYLLFLGSCFLWVYQIKDFVGEDAIDSAEMLFSFLGIPSFKMIAIVCIFFIISLAVSALMIIQSLYFGITISNVKPFSKLGIIGAILGFFLCFYVVQTLSVGVSELLPMGMVVSPKTIVFTSDTVGALAEAGKNAIKINFTGPIFRLIAGIALNFPIVFLAKNYVNVK